MRSDTLRVPGATLYYEVRGSGPLLLMIPGGGGDAASSDGVAEILQRHYTVVSFDPRGYGRSRLDSGVPERQYVAVQREDVRLLLEHLTDEPAAIFGGSSGAIVGLDLLANHPERVRRLVAHEPPCFAILPDAAEHRAMAEEVETLARAGDPAAAGARFLAAIGNVVKPLPEGAAGTEHALAMRARQAVNGPIMFEYEFREFTSYVPDFEALAAVADRLVPAAGRETRGHLPYRPIATIAERLGRELVEFPGAHNGGFSDAPEFARQLLDALAADHITESISATPGRGA
ncbi:alpha/beta fold hydrolase [Nocardia terpenica]|uniref:Alpha/beta fold hydrolase n=1 Tax=Nocardia terpenica TaxID=455432 RepID=A0A6G9Z570_9NOCA|nr:alpha/beta hydrolase [Nocardia terpenica]QIS20326.1 alpha/beta fold hydrolase [Nocardia terpenica]